MFCFALFINGDIVIVIITMKMIKLIGIYCMVNINTNNINQRVIICLCDELLYVEYACSKFEF